MSGLPDWQNVSVRQFADQTPLDVSNAIVIFINYQKSIQFILQGASSVSHNI